MRAAAWFWLADRASRFDGWCYRHGSAIRRRQRGEL